MLFLNFKSVLIKKSSYRHMFDIVEQYYSIYSIEIEDNRKLNLFEEPKLNFMSSKSWLLLWEKSWLGLSDKLRD